jgi:hypothetical protein
MNLTFMQCLSKHFGVFLGKVSGLGGDDNAFAHDYHATFLNSGLDLNVALALFPLTSYGGGLVLLPWEGTVVTVAALDPSGTATNNDAAVAEDRQKDIHGTSLPARLAAQRESVTFGLVFTCAAVYRVHSMDASAAQWHDVAVPLPLFGRDHVCPSTMTS